MTLSIIEGDSNMPKGGPPSQEGKEVVKWNATRHGLRSPAPVVPGVEKVEEWEEHRDGILENLSPEGHLEMVLAERIALLSWRLHRVIRYETESIALYQEQIEEDLARQRRFGSGVLGAHHPEEVRWKLKDAQRTHRTLKKLPGLPHDKHLSGADAAGVLWGVSAYIEDEDLEKVRPPSGVPDWAGVEEDSAEWDGWTVGMVMEYVDSMASEAGESPKELLEAATEKARLDVISAKGAVERVEKDLERMSRERLLPDEKTLEKVARYEAHLSRGLYKTLHELEALQVRRAALLPWLGWMWTDWRKAKGGAFVHLRAR
jgi:hypothetical protein